MSEMIVVAAISLFLQDGRKHVIDRKGRATQVVGRPISGDRRAGGFLLALCLAASNEDQPYQHCHHEQSHAVSLERVDVFISQHLGGLGLLRQSHLHLGIESGDRAVRNADQLIDGTRRLQLHAGIGVDRALYVFG